MKRNLADCAFDEAEKLRDEIRRHDAPMRRLIEIESEHPELVAADSPTQRVGGKPREGLVKVSARAAGARAMKRNSAGSAADETEKLRDEIRRNDALMRPLIEIQTAHPELVAADSPTLNEGKLREFER